MLVLNLQDIAAIYLERLGGPHEERYTVAFQGQRDTNILAAADAFVRIWAMKSPPKDGDSHPVRFRLVFAHGHKMSGVFDMRKEHAWENAVFQNYIGERLHQLNGQDGNAKHDGRPAVAVGGAV